MIRESRLVRIGNADYPESIQTVVPLILYNQQKPLVSLWEIVTALLSFPMVRVMGVSAETVPQIEAQLHDLHFENETFTVGMAKSFRREAKILNDPFIVFITREVEAKKRKRRSSS